MAEPDSPEKRSREAARPPSRSGLSGPAFLIGVTVLLALIAVVYWPQKTVAPRPRPVQRVDRVAALERRVQSDEAHIATLEGVARELKSLSSRVATLEQTQPTAPSAATTPLSVMPLQPDLAAKLDAYALKSDEAALAARVSKLEGQNPGAAIRSATAALALANLVRASDRAGGFAAELHALAPLVPASPETGDLARYARGVPDEAVLAAQFPKFADAAIAADRRANARGWLARLWVNLSTLVSIRRVGERAGDDVESRMARASARLRAGDLPGAVGEVRALDGPAHDAVASWLANAQARVAVDRDLAALTDRLVATLSQQSGGAP